MATTDIGRVTPIWRGFYSAAATYELNDIVIDTAGSVWWHKSEELTTGVIPEAGEIWDAVIDMSVFSALIQAAITTAQTAVQAAQEAESEVAEDVRRAETAAQSAEASAEAASESAAGVGALAQAAERSAEAAAGSATGAAGSAQAAAGSKSDAEAYAVGKRGGTDVGVDDPTYHNNAKFYADQAGSSAEAAAGSKSDAEAYAVGKRGGVEVGSDDPAYHNNAKYWSDQAAATAEDIAESSAQITQNAADVSDLKSALTHTESEVNAIGQFVGYGIIPVVKIGKYYTGSAGSAYSTTDNNSSVYIDPVDVSELIGKKLTIYLDATNDGSRCFGFCDEDGIIDTVYTEANSRSMFIKHGDKYDAAFDITGKYFFFSYAKFADPSPEFSIPSNKLIYTKSEIDTQNQKTESSISKCLDFTKNGYLDLTQPDYSQIGTEKRIWFSGDASLFVPAVQAGDVISVTDNNYDVGLRVGNGVTYWYKSIVVPSENYVGYGLRKSDLSDISGLTQSQIKTIVRAQRISNTLKTESNKKTHFSIDDCLFWTDLIDNENTYTSIFENSFLSDLKDIHDENGAKFTLNCFCSTTGYDISDVPTKFASEFMNNSDWLKFSFHAEDSSSSYSTDDVAGITASYEKFITAIYSMTSSLDCIDTVVRLAAFTGSLNNVEAIRDEDCGITGLLSADDTRVSYYFDTAQNNFMIKKGKMFDATNQLLIIKSQKRIEYVTSINDFCQQFLTTEYGNFKNYLEFFTHEYEWNGTIKSKVLSLTNWLASSGYKFGYWET